MGTAVMAAVEQWFRAEPEPHLLGQRCGTCSDLVFPPTATTCRRPGCEGGLEEARLPRTGRLWSYATNHYPPPPPAQLPEPFEPYTVAAVALDGRGPIVLGLMPSAVDASGLRAGTRMELVSGPLYGEDDQDMLVWMWQPVTAAHSEADHDES